jgi:hypothetical protein
MELEERTTEVVSRQGVQYWEYKTLAYRDSKHIEMKFNELGQQGWEYVAIAQEGSTTGYHIFKRSL